MPLPDLTRVRDVDRPLNKDEFDADIDNLDQRLIAIEDDPPTAVSIADITSDGDQMTITLSDASTFNITMPFKQLNPRVYAEGAVLAIMDVFPTNGSLYVVTWPHTAAAVFDPAANDGLGHNYYFEILPNPGNSLPDGGELGQVLFKLDSDNYHVGWRFLAAIYVEYVASSDSNLVSDNVADALEELEALIAATAAGLSYDALDISYSPSSASGLGSTNVGDALDELGERVTDFTDLSGSISPTQSRKPVTALGSVSGTVALDPDDGEVFTITPTGAVTLDAASAPAGARVVLHVITSGTSSYNITFGTGFKSTGVLATGTVTAKNFSITFDGNGSDLVEACRTTAM